VSDTDDIVSHIVAELCKHDTHIKTNDAIAQARAVIARLCDKFQKRLHEPKPSMSRKRIDDLAHHARALLGIARLQRDVREQIDLYLSERGETLANWLKNVKTVADVLGLLGKVPHRRSAFQLDCALAAADLICQLSPKTDLATLAKTPGRPFYLIASYLWFAVSGKKDQDLKRHCDAVLESWRRGIAEDGNTAIVSIDLRNS
jgi:hypothetical protein